MSHKFIRATLFGRTLTIIRFLRAKIYYMQHSCHNGMESIKNKHFCYNVERTSRWTRIHKRKISNVHSKFCQVSFITGVMPVTAIFILILYISISATKVI
jgi:hypothetical protein